MLAPILAAINDEYSKFRRYSNHYIRPLHRRLISSLLSQYGHSYRNKKSSGYDFAYFILFIARHAGYSSRVYVDRLIILYRIQSFLSALRRLINSGRIIIISFSKRHVVKVHSAFTDVTQSCRDIHRLSLFHFSPARSRIKPFRL